MNSNTLGEELQKNQGMETKEGELGILKKWMFERQELVPLDKADLALFWHRNEYNIEKTKINIENYFKMRTEMTEFFNDRDPVNSDALNQTFETVSVIVLPKRTPEGYAVVLMQLLDTEPNQYDFLNAVKYLNMVVDVHVYQEGTSNGYLFVCDLRGVKPKHVDNLPDVGLNNFFQYMNEGAHFRWKGMHYVNSKPRRGTNDYVRRKIIDIQTHKNVYLHERLEDLAKAVPLQLLPTDMGGDAGYLEALHDAQIKKLKDYSAWFKVEARFRIQSNNENDNQLNKPSGSGSSVC